MQFPWNFWRLVKKYIFIAFSLSFLHVGGMRVEFNPSFTITRQMISGLQRIEVARQKLEALVFTPFALKAAKEDAKAECVTYFRMIEDVAPNGELTAYLAARKLVHKWAKEKITLSEKHIRALHAQIVDKKASPYRPGQNGVLDGKTKEVVYLPPKAKDVPILMKALIIWLDRNPVLACPITAGIVHFGINMIHPYYDGNGRTARLITRFILQKGGYDLKELVCLEKYYAEDLYSYYTALEVGGAKSYYSGRAHVNITSWLEYFLQATGASFEHALQRARRCARGK